MKNIIGIDIGGTKILAGRFSSSDLWEAEETFRCPTEAKMGRGKVIKNLLRAIGKLKNKETTAIGLSWAGFVDGPKGIIRKSPNLPGFEDFAITDYLQQTVDIPVYHENDAKLFALAEQKKCSNDPKNVLGIILGTGVGSGVILNGEVLSGSDNFAGEIGAQLIFDTETKSQSSSNKLFSGPALTEYLGMTLEVVEEKYKSNPLFIRDLQQKMEPRIEQMSDWLFNLIFVLNPDKIILGGGAGQHFWPLFLPKIETLIKQKIKDRDLPVNFSLKIASLENAGLIGAALLAQSR